MNANRRRTTVNAIGQRARSQNHVNALPKFARAAIASPSFPPSTIRSMIPARTVAEASRRTSEISLTFQSGRVSSRSYARFTAFTTELIAPRPAQSAPKMPRESRTTEPLPVSRCSCWTMLVTDLGATGSRKSWSAPKAPIRSRNAIRKIIAGKKASSELYAISCESPMQSSARNSLPLDLKAPSQARRPRRSASAAVDKGEPPEASLLRALAVPTDHPHRGADPARDDEAGGERSRGDHGELGADLRPDVRRL